MFFTPPTSSKSNPESTTPNVKPKCLFNSAASASSSAATPSSTINTVAILPAQTSVSYTPNSTHIAFSSLLNKVNTMSQQTLPSSNVGNMVNPNVKLTFVNNEEISKFVGNPTQFDTTFAPGPKIEEFLNHFNAYIVRHNITTDADKLIALRMLVHPSMGDARFVLSSLLDDTLGTNITFQQVSDYLIRLYKSETSLNFFRACNNFIELCKPKNDGVNDLMQFRSIEVATKELLQAYLDKPNQANSQKNDSQKIFEILSLMAFSIYAGEKVSKSLIKEDLSQKDLFVKAKELIRLQALQDEKKKDSVVLQISEEEENSVVKKKNFDLKKRRTMQIKGKKTLICFRCGLENSHTAKSCNTKIDLFCSFCLKRGHVNKVCFKKQANSNFRTQ